jgi:hypothetical protein
MKITGSLVLASSLTLSLAIAGCATVSGDTAKTSATPTALVVEVPDPPPPSKDEVKSPCPAPGHIWVAGYWDYIGGHHVWREGRWVQAMAGYEYVRARYEWDGKAWQFHIPHWHRRAITAPTNLAQARPQ